MSQINSFFFSGEAHSAAEQKQGQRAAYVQFTLRQVTPAKGQYPEREILLNFVVFGDMMQAAKGIKRGDRILVQGKIGSTQKGDFLNPSLQVVGLMVTGPAPAQAAPKPQPKRDDMDLSDEGNFPF